MLFSLITFTEQQGESLLHLFEVFGGSHRFGPENEKKKIMQLQMWVWMVPLSLLDYAPNYLVGCVIQKRITRFWIYYRLLSPLRPRRLIVMKWIKGGHGGNWIYCWSDDTKRCKWSWNSVVGKSRNWFGLFWCGWDFFSICCCFCSGGSTDDIWGNFAGWWWCIILKYVENLDVGIFRGKC